MKLNNRGQISVFVIIAIVLVAGIILYYTVKNTNSASNVPAEFNAVYTYYEQCIEDEAKTALSLTGARGGRIQDEIYAPGSDYAPFSSHLNFVGTSVPYWYYISGNGLVKEQVPSLSQIQREMESFIAEQLGNCELGRFEQQGLTIQNGKKPETNVRIENTRVVVNINSKLRVSNNAGASEKNDFEVTIPSKFGKFYKLARELYDKEKEEAFLENYSVDVLRLYAPVDGVEISCSPKVWKAREVASEIHKGLEANIAALKFKGDKSYEISSKPREYFVINHVVDESVRMLYSARWPSRTEISGAEEELMIAEPVGNQEGMGILGFCYAPYHFVYDLSFPVMFQIFDEQELFQFPVVVVIDNNVPRQALPSSFESEPERVDVCTSKSEELIVSVYDAKLAPVDARLSYTCFEQRCPLGETKNGVFNGKAPACLNGYLQVRAEGYAEKRQLLSTNSEHVRDVILDREYPVNVSLNVGGKPLTGTAFVSFAGEATKSLSLPELQNVALSEGPYNITVYVYGNSSIVIPASTKRQCFETSNSGLSGLFGGTHEECTDIILPETKVDYALIGGGEGEQYFLASELEGGKITLNVDALPHPNSLQELQNNYESFDTLGVGVSFS